MISIDTIRADVVRILRRAADEVEAGANMSVHEFKPSRGTQLATAGVRVVSRTPDETAHLDGHEGDVYTESEVGIVMTDLWRRIERSK